ncbi:hypothetical protein SSAG_04036 [Streptomyces sp. Mg1]|nr:hypothetical protein SSAG_04036 [Streptomyces sp. Mg1]
MYSPTPLGRIYGVALRSADTIRTLGRMPVPHAKALSPARRPGRLLIACTTVLLIVGPTAAAPAVAADSVSYDFESPSRKLPFMAINGFGRVLVGPAPGGGRGRPRV